MLDFVTMVWDDLLAFLSRRAAPTAPGDETGPGDDANIPSKPISGPPSLSAAAEPEAQMQRVELSSSIPDDNARRDE